MMQIMFVDELREAQRAGHPGRASADDHDIGLHLRTVDIFKRFAKVDHFISGKKASRQVSNCRSRTPFCSGIERKEASVVRLVTLFPDAGT